MDELARKRRQLIVRGAGLVAGLYAYMMFVFRAREQTPRITVGSMADRAIARDSNLRYIYHSSDINCSNQLRMRKAPFFRLCALFRERELLLDSIHTSIEEQVAMFLLVVGHNQRYRTLQPIFRRSTEVISRYFKAVLYAVGELRDEMIRPPSNQCHPKIQQSTRFNPYFKDCVGAIDGTHVLARVPRRISAAFRGRKVGTTQNVMAAVDFDLKFTYVLAGWEGSAHDALILANALERDDGLKVPTGKFFLVDAGYAVRPGFLPPYRGTRWMMRCRRCRRASVLTEEDSVQCSNMSDVVREIATAINNTCHAETHPDLYNTVMDLVVFTLDERLAVLDYLTEHKAKGLNFVKMDDEVRQASFKRILKANPDLL